MSWIPPPFPEPGPPVVSSWIHDGECHFRLFLVIPSGFWHSVHSMINTVEHPQPFWLLVQLNSKSYPSDLRISSTITYTNSKISKGRPTSVRPLSCSLFSFGYLYIDIPVHAWTKESDGFPFVVTPLSSLVEEHSDHVGCKPRFESF